MSMQIARPALLNHIISPYGISIFSTLVFLVAWVFPPPVYTGLMNEPDLMFLDAETLLFFLLCVAGFWVGLLLIDFVFPSPALLESKSQPSHLKGLTLLLPLIITTAMTVLVGIQIFKNSPDALVLLLAQQADTLKVQQADQGATGPLGWASIMQISILWWTYWNLINSKPSRPRRFYKRRLLPWLIFFVGLLVQIVLCIFKVSRADLMPVLAGVAVLYLLGKIRRKELGTAGLLRYCLLFSGAVISLFILLGMLRNTTDLSVGLGSFVGYTLASYNRLTAILHGTMHYPYAGHGVYLSDFLAYNKAFNDLVPLKTTLGWPDFLELWNSEFQAPQRAGLRYDLIWSGVFGYLFSDFGWATPLILTGYGTIYGLVWRSVKSGSTVGIALYPWFAFTALCWFSSNMVFGVKAVFFLTAGLSLMAYEKLISAKFFSSFSRGLKSR
jgi:hypothetical protein